MYKALDYLVDFTIYKNVADRLKGTGETVYGRAAMEERMKRIEYNLKQGNATIAETKPFRTFKWLLTPSEIHKTESWIGTITSKDLKSKILKPIVDKKPDGTDDGAGTADGKEAASSGKAEAIVPFDSVLGMSVAPTAKPLSLGPKAKKVAKADAALKEKNDHLLTMFLGKKKRAKTA